MRIVMFYHSLISDWNHGNAHFLRGVATDLISRGHEVLVYEPENSWSVENLLMEKGRAPLRAFSKAYPLLSSTRYRLDKLDVSEALDGADLVIVHEWNDRRLVKKIGEHRARCRRNPYTLLFHDTHHRSVTVREELSRYDLSAYDGVLAFGGVIRDIYLQEKWTQRAWVWHEAADSRVFRALPRKSFDGDLVWIGYWGDDERSAELNEFLIRPVYNALDPSTHFPLKPNLRFAGDLGFLGNRLTDREARVDEFFLRAAKLCPDQQFLLGGSGWQDKVVPANIKYLGHVYTTDHNAFNCTPKTVLNISRDSMARYGFSPATRVFEAAGAAACMITD
jgi:spore maturation protein CgeB